MYDYITAQINVPAATAVNAYVPAESGGATIDEAALERIMRRVVRGELDAVLAGLALTAVGESGQSGIETEVAGAALDGGMPWD